jgi:hypothetical protein
MADGFVHTVYKAGNWVNETEGGSDLAGTFSTKEDAAPKGVKRGNARPSM